MPKIVLPRVTRPIDLAKYSPEMAAAAAGNTPDGSAMKPIWMWVNVTEGRKGEYFALQTRIEDLRNMLNENRKQREKNKAAREQAEKDGIQDFQEAPLPHAAEDLDRWFAEVNKQTNEWWADVWSQNPDPSTHWEPEDIEELAHACLESDPGFWEWIHAQCWAAVREYRVHAKNPLPTTS